METLLTEGSQYTPYPARAVVDSKPRHFAPRHLAPTYHPEAGTMMPLPHTVESPHKDIEQYLRDHIVGQDHAIDAIMRGLNKPPGLDNKPIANLLFMGPTGTGKTEMTKALNEAFEARGKDVSRIHLDCSALAHSHEATAFLLGSPPGYIGYGNPPFFDRKKFALRGTDQLTILVLDELEKADDQLFKVLMPVFDEGNIQLNNGDITWFTNTIIIATSNVGSEEMSKRLKPSLGFARPDTDTAEHAAEIEEAARKGIESRFGHLPELIARFNEIVVFQPHSPDSLLNILESVVRARNKKLRRRHGVEISLSDGTQQHLLDAVKGDRHLGARPLVNEFQNQIETMLGRYVAAGHLPPGNRLVVKTSAELSGGERHSEYDDTTSRRLAFFALSAPELDPYAPRRVIEEKPTFSGRLLELEA